MKVWAMIVDGEFELIPLDVNVRTFTHIIVRGKRIECSPAMTHLHYYNVNGVETAVFVLPRALLEQSE